MGSRSNPRSSSEVLPPGALPCIWMTAGLISYRLCNLEYACESCPLDAALRDVEPHKTTAEETLR